MHKYFLIPSILHSFFFPITEYSERIKYIFNLTILLFLYLPVLFSVYLLSLFLYKYSHTPKCRWVHEITGGSLHGMDHRHSPHWAATPWLSSGPKGTGIFKAFTCSPLGSCIDSTKTMTDNSTLPYEECSLESEIRTVVCIPMWKGS